MRKSLIAGNWKMFLGADEARSLARQIAEAQYDRTKTDVMLAPSFVLLPVVQDTLKSLNAKHIITAAQNVYTEDSGAFTGEVSLPMLQSVGTSAVILGHSERRHIFGETDTLINKKIHKVLSGGMMAVICVGELLDEREAGVAIEVVLAQLGKSLAGVENLNNVVVAYEPVWAIGTGKTASPDDAQAMHHAIRGFIAKQYGNAVADKLRILYGGSVKPENISDLMAQKDVDGALVGGASLKADQFKQIINY